MGAGSQQLPSPGRFLGQDPGGAISNTSSIRMDLQNVKNESEAYLDPKSSVAVNKNRSTTPKSHRKLCL